MTLQEMREARKNLQAELTKMSSTVAERRSAGKSGSELWSPEEQANFDKLTGDIAKLDGDIASEERAEGLVAHMSEWPNSETQHSEMVVRIHGRPTRFRRRRSAVWRTIRGSRPVTPVRSKRRATLLGVACLGLRGSRERTNY